jgi:hypothetical protein
MGLRSRMRRTQLLPVRLVKTLHSTISQISIADVLKQKIQAPKLLNSTTDKLSRCLRSRRRRQEPPHYPERDQRYTLQLLEISDGLVLIRCHRPCCRESQGSTCKDSFRILQPRCCTHNTGHTCCYWSATNTVPLLLREPLVMEQPPSFRHRLSLDRPVYLCGPISQCPPICNEAYVGYSSYHCCS